MEILAVIPARGGSKGLPGKNIVQLGGHPLVSYSICAALKSSLITRVICSTDDHDIAKVAKSYGAEVPFLRPQKLAQDSSTDTEVFIDLLSTLLEKESYKPDLVVHFRPTSPFRTLAMIEEAINLIKNNSEVDSVRSVCITSLMNPFKMWMINKNGLLDPLLTLEDNPEPYNSLRQNLPVTYVQSGTLDVARSSVILEKKSMTGKIIKPLVIEAKYFIDIDKIENLRFAEVMISHLDIIKP